MQSQENASRTPIHRPQSQVSHPQSLHGLTITESELRRRVDYYIDRALDKRDHSTLKHLLSFIRAKFNATPRGIVAQFEETEEHVEMLRWFVTLYADLVESVQVVLQVAGVIATTEHIHRQALVARWLDIKATCPKPEELTRTVAAAQGGAGHTILTEITGTALPAVRLRLKRTLAQRAMKWASGSSIREIANAGQILQIQIFLESQMANTDGLAHTPAQSPAPFAEQAPVEPGSALEQRTSQILANNLRDLTAASRTPPGKPGLPDDTQVFAEKMKARAEWVMRQLSCQSPSENEDKAKVLKKHMAAAVKTGDPVEVAALCQLMWLEGISTNIKNAIELMSEHEQTASAPKYEKRTEIKKNDGFQTDYIDTEELARRTGYDTRTIRDNLMRRHMIEGVHYKKPFGRKILFVWSAIQRDFFGNPAQG